MAISYEDYKKKIQEKYKYTTERNPRKPLNQRYNAIERGSYYDISENALDTAINRYNTYGEAIGSMSNFSDKAINSALEQATNNMNTYKSNIIDAAKKNNIETSNNKNIVKSQSEYGKEELDYLRNNKYEALKNVKEPLKLTDVASSAQKKYKENKEKFDELVKENKDYKEYDEYLYNAVPLLQNMKNINEVNKEGVSTADKILVPVISGARNSLRNIFMPSSGEYRLANNNLVNLPTKSDVKAEKVLNSYDTGIGEFLGKTAYSIGQQLPSMAIGLATGGLGTAAGASASAINAARTVGSLSSMFANVSRNTTNQKLMEGYTKEQANQYGLMSGAVETATELMFGGLGKLMGTGALDRVVTDRLTRNIQNRVFRTLADAGISSVGEGVEEVVSDLLQPVVQKIALDDPRKYSEIMKDQNVLEDFLVGTISSLIMSAPSTVVSFANNNQNTPQTNINQVNLPPTTNLQESVVNDAVNSRIQRNNWQSMLKNNTTNVPINSQNGIINANLYQYLTTNNNKINQLRESASQYFNNSTQTQNFINTIEKIVTDKDYNVMFDDSIVNSRGESVNAQISTENGETIIKLNPNSDRVGEFLLVHEITHAIETDSMKQLVLDFASKNPDFNQALESLKQTYGTNDVTSEVVADISGQLLGNQEFINSLTMQNTPQSRSIIRQIYESIRRLLNTLTESGRYRNFVQDLETKWREAYRTTTSEQVVNNINNGTQYHLSSTALNEVVDTLQNPNTDINSLVKLRDYTPQVLMENGVADLPMMVRKGHLRENILTEQEALDRGFSVKGKHYHGLGVNIYLQAIDSLDNPVAIYQYTNKGKYNTDNYVVLTSVIDSNSNSIIVPIEINKRGQYNSVEIDINRIKTVYGRETQNYFDNKVANNELKEIYSQKRSAIPSVQFGSHSTSSVNNIPQSTQNVNSDTSTRYSMQEVQNDALFNTDAKRYNDLIKTNYIEYFKKDNGDVRVYLMDSNYNLVNQLDLWSETYAINQLGNNLGTRLFNSATDNTQKINIGNDINNLGTETDYFMNHRPTQTGLTADNIANQNVETPIPQDVYEHPEYYFQMTEKSFQESFAALRKVKDKPDAEITIYRATPGNKINKGDWITLSKTYAEWHNQSQFNGTANVLEMTVKAREVQFAGDDINEFGYFPDGDIQNSISNTTWQEHLEQNYQSSGTRTNMQNIKIPTQQDIQGMQNSNINPPPVNRVLNPLEISRLTPEDANTTPILPNINRNQNNNGNSRFYCNIKEKTNMLNEQQKNTILSEEEVQYYDKITNKESLEKAFERLNENGRHETENWFAKDSENATAIDVAEGWILLKQYADSNDSDGMVAVAKKLRDMGTKAGQTVQAFNIMARMTPEGMVKYAQSELSEAYDRMVKGKTQKWIDKYQKDFDLSPQETGAIMEIMKKVSAMEDGYNKRVELAKIQKIMTDKLPPERGAGIKSWMRISMLFNAKTQVRNVAGNAIIAPVNAFSDLFASMADKVVGAKTGYRTTGVTNIKNYVKGFKEGAYQSYNDFRKGINTRNIQGNRFEISEGKSFNNNTPIGKALNRVDSLLSFMLDAGDRTFYEATFTNSINNQLVLNNTTEVTQEMIDIATQEALSRTWQDNNNYTRFVLSVRKMLNNINVRGYGLGDVLIPFAKTPANLTKAIVDYSPAGVVNVLVKGNQLKNAIQTGQFTPQMQHEFVQSLGKATIGTMLYIAGYALAKAGIVSGESDDDKDVQNFMKNTLGVNSYSIKIGDMSFTYDWAQPIAAPLSIMANIVQKDKEDASTLETIISSLDTAGNILLEQSFMESINTALSNNDGLATGIEEAILDLPARAIPTLMKQIVDLTDDTQRTSFEYDKPIQSMINSIKAKIPGLSQTLAPSVDTMGREIQRYGGNNNIFNVFLNPANVSTENISESAEEIYRLYKETGKTDIMPRVAPYYINKDGEKITLDSNTRAEYQKTSGQIIEDNVKKLLEMSEYNSLSDEKKADIINDIVNYSYSIAQNEVLDVELSDTYKKAYEYSKIGDISDYYTFQNNIDDTDSNTKRESIKNYLINSSLNDNQISYLYRNYYSSEETLNNLIEIGIPIKEFIKFDTQEFEGDYNTRTGKTVSGSRKNKVIQYVNSLNLSIPQKAILIKMEYNSYDNYNNQIVNYINGLNKTVNDKKVLLKSIGFDNFNKDVVEYINSQNISIAEKEEKLKDLGFTIRNRRVYW